MWDPFSWWSDTEDVYFVRLFKPVWSGFFPSTANLGKRCSQLIVNNCWNPEQPHRHGCVDSVLIVLVNFAVKEKSTLNLRKTHFFSWENWTASKNVTSSRENGDVVTKGSVTITDTYSQKLVLKKKNSVYVSEGAEEIMSLYRKPNKHNEEIEMFSWWKQKKLAHNWWATSMAPQNSRHRTPKKASLRLRKQPQ